MLLEPPSDTWWLLDHETQSTDYLAATLGAHLSRAVEWLLERSTNEALLRELRSYPFRGEHWYHRAALESIIGSQEQATQLLDESKERYRFNEMKLRAVQDMERRILTFASENRIGAGD